MKISAPIDQFFPLPIGMREKVNSVIPEERERARPLPSRHFDSCCDLDTLCRAREILEDGERLEAAKAEAKRQSESFGRLARLKGKIL